MPIAAACPRTFSLRRSLLPMLNWSLSVRRRITAVIALGIAALGGCVGLDAQERKWIFQASAIHEPDRALRTQGAAEPAPEDARMQGVWIGYPSRTSGADVKLQALWYPNDDPKAPALLYLHGARRGIEDSGFRIEQMRDLGFSVLALEYRGFGRSTDELPSEATVTEDARAGWQWLERVHPALDRYIFGHSLGGAIAVDLASQVQDAKGLIVEGTFTSIADVVSSFRWGWLPIAPLITQHFDSVGKIARIKVPVLVVHGAADSLIPPSLGRALFDKVTAKKRFVLVEGGTHYSTNRIGQAQYREALRALFGLGA